MNYIQHYDSSLGRMLLCADDEGLTGLWFEGQRYFPDEKKLEGAAETETEILKETKRWLDIYFEGKEPDFTPPLHPQGSDFRKMVWEKLTKIPYGTTVTYGDIAKQIAKEKGIRSMSAQAVGGAVGHNNISIIIPCHRVVGTGGSLTGYAGGIDRKFALLVLENIIKEDGDWQR